MSCPDLLRRDSANAHDIEDDPDDLPESVRACIDQIAHDLLNRGCPPTPERVALALERLEHDPIDEGALAARLVSTWRNRLDEADWLDPAVLQAHLEMAPLPDHPLCYYLMGMIGGLTYGRIDRK